MMHNQKNQFRDEVSAAICELPIFLRSIETNIDTSIECFNSDNTEDGELYLNKVMNCISSFIKLSSILCRETFSLNPTFDSTSIKNLQIHLLSLIKGIQFALKSSDMIMLNDLLEYELKDNLSQWRISTIPTLKVLIKK